MQDIRSAVAAEFEQVNHLIIDQLHSDVDMVENIGHYIVDAGGTRLRPLLVLLTAAAFGRCGPDQIKFAAVIEFIHTATLLHDDVVDISSLRRGRPTANAEFGNAPSVLVGDFLYTRAFQLMVQLGDMDILTHMANTTNTIAEGEVLQLVRAGNADTTEQQYLDVITRKTAILFAAGCYGAATLCHQESSVCQGMHSFGLNLGIAFQMIDDILDYEGDPAAMGKNVGDDLTEGKPTLPLIQALKKSTDAGVRDMIRNAIEHGGLDQLEVIVSTIESTGALEYTRALAQDEADQALTALQALPETPYKQGLASRARFAVERSS